MLKNYRTANQVRILTAFVLTGILSISSGLFLIKNATAEPANLLSQTSNEVFIKSNQLPRAVANAVLQDLARKERMSIRELKITNYSQQTWRDGCLEIPRSGEFCTQALVPGWRVFVSHGRRNWIYHTNKNGQYFRLAAATNLDENSPNQLPTSVKNAVLQDASQRLQKPISQLMIIQTQSQTWRDGCLELGGINELCSAALVPGWLVTVSAVDQTLIYHTNQTGSVVKLNENASENVDNQLPRKISNAVLQDASERLQQPLYRLRIIQAEQRNWRDGCLELARPNEGCTREEVPGWLVTVAIAQQRLVYHTDNDSLVKFNPAASNIINDGSTVQPVPIPASELPPPLDQGVVFREISSGGLAGRTYETVLLDDGRLIRVRIGDANDSERSVRRITPQKVQQFQRSLKRYRFGKFKNLSYPAPNGAADYITYTLTSQQGTVQYNDISQDSLPQNLREVVTAWNQIIAVAR